MRSTLRIGVALIVVGATLSGTPSLSGAEPVLGLDLDGGFPVGDSRDVTDPGFGVGLRFGWRFDLPDLLLRAEVAFTYNTFSLPRSGERFADLLRVVGGLRLGYDNQWVPYAYGHLGYGDFAVEFAEDDFRNSAGGLTWDAGVAWEPLGGDDWRLGLHVAYVSTRVRADSRFELVAAGIHGDMLF